MEDTRGISPGKLFAMIVLGILIIWGVFGSWTIIHPGYVGVPVLWGQVQKQTFTPGAHFKIPYAESVIGINTQVQKEQVPASAASKDLQTVNSTVAINYHVDPNMAGTLYQNVGLGYANTVIAPAIQEAIKSTTAQYDAQQLITDRQQVSNEAQTNLSKVLRPYGIVVNALNIVNFDFSKQFDNAVEAKNVALQQAEQAKYTLQQKEVEAQQTVVTAKAAAEAQALQDKTLTPELVQLKQLEVEQEAIAKWNGQLPTYSGGATPFLNIK